MKKRSLFQWFRDISIAKKLYFTVGAMALLIGMELFTLFFSLNTLSAVRAYVGGEGLWSKAQKDAVYHLYRYGISRDEKDYQQFNECMNVLRGDGKARRELMKPNPDLEVARLGLLEGQNHPEDVNGMIWLFRRFSSISYISKAISIWQKAEPAALQFVPIADQLHAEIHSASPSDEKIKLLLDRIGPINENLTGLENDFSYTLGEGSRWLEGLVMKLLFIIALTVEITGLLLTISVSRGIQRGLSEIILAARSFAKGNLQTRAKVFSKDEIGLVAQSFNQMSGELAQSFARLEQEQRKFRSLLDSAPDAIVIIDKAGIIRIVNAQTEKMFGYERKALLDQSIVKLVKDRFGIFRTSQVTSAALTGIELFGHHKNQKTFPVEISLGMIETDEGELISVAIRDISERKHIKELENKNQELEQFAYIASHDLQEPLNTINSFTMLLESENKEQLNPDASEYISYIKESSDRLRTLITGLLEYSRIGKKSELGQVDCNETLREVISDMSAAIRSNNAEVECTALPVITAYPIEIRLLLQNLLSNAIKYRRKEIAPKVSISAKNENKSWQFTIEDNGIGIEPKYRDKVFVIFQRLHSHSDYPGTGIGLAHCKKIVEFHNGKIWLESSPGNGSRFHFTIPQPS